MACYFDEISPGDGCTRPKAGQTVVVHYSGYLGDKLPENGTQRPFDSSRERGQPFRFVVGKDQVIKGWEEKIVKMSIGQRVKLICPPNYAYGKQGFPGVIPANSTLIFDLELIAME